MHSQCLSQAVPGPEPTHTHKRYIRIVSKTFLLLLSSAANRSTILASISRFTYPPRQPLGVCLSYSVAIEINAETTYETAADH